MSTKKAEEPLILKGIPGFSILNQRLQRCLQKSMYSVLALNNQQQSALDMNGSPMLLQHIAHGQGLA